MSHRWSHADRAPKAGVRRTFGTLVDSARSDQQATKGELKRRIQVTVPWLKGYGILNAVQAGLTHSSLADKEKRGNTFN